VVSGKGVPPAQAPRLSSPLVCCRRRRADGCLPRPHGLVAGALLKARPARHASAAMAQNTVYTIEYDP
jgi:hypothetical protein